MVIPYKPGRGESWGIKNMGKAGNTGVAPLGATRVFPLSSFRPGPACKIGVPPRHKPYGTSDAAVLWTFPSCPPSMVTPPPSRGYLGQWRRLWGTEQSRPSSPQSSRLTYEPSEKTGRTSRCRSAQAGGSTPSWRSWRQRWTQSPEWSRWHWSGSTQTEWCISRTCYSLSGSTCTQPADVSFPSWASCLPRAYPRWWIFPMRPSRISDMFAPWHEWNMSHTLGVSLIPSGRQGHVRRRGRRLAWTIATWISGGWLLYPRTALLGCCIWRRTDLSTSYTHPRVCFPC